MSDGWHILREGACVTVARHLPVRFDVAAEAAFPPVGRLRLATQVRQDLWRMLQRVRGFSPVIMVEARDGGLWLRAGGRVSGPAPVARLNDRIAAVLNDADHRARWIAHAGGADG